MKHLLSITICCISFFGIAQTSEKYTDTLFLSNGEIVSGIFLNEDITTYQFIIANTKKVISYKKGEVLRIARAGEIEILNNQTVLKKAVPDTITHELLVKEFKKLKYRSELSSWHLEQAGNWGIASAVFGIGGGIMALAGGLTGKPVVAYVGAGVGAFGFLYTIPAFVNLKKAGRVKQE
jgi:hypothetical protein